MSKIDSSADSTSNPATPVPPALLWTGRILCWLPALMMLMSAGMKLSQSPMIAEGFTKFGYDPKLAFGIGVIELICTILYLIPRTAAIGAILLTGYLGGAIGTHLRIGDPWIAPLLIGVVLWLGLVLRFPRLRAILPW